MAKKTIHFAMWFNDYEQYDEFVPICNFNQYTYGTNFTEYGNNITCKKCMKYLYDTVKAEKLFQKRHLQWEEEWEMYIC